MPAKQRRGLKKILSAISEEDLKGRRLEVLRINSAPLAMEYLAWLNNQIGFTYSVRESPDNQAITIVAGYKEKDLANIFVLQVFNDSIEVSTDNPDVFQRLAAGLEQTTKQAGQRQTNEKYALEMTA